MIRTIKVAKDVAVKARTSAMITLKQVLANAPPALREELQPLSRMALIRRCAALRPGKVDNLTSAAKYTLSQVQVSLAGQALLCVQAPDAPTTLERSARGAASCGRVD